MKRLCVPFEEMATCVNMVISLLPELNPQAAFCGLLGKREHKRGELCELTAGRIIDKT